MQFEGGRLSRRFLVVRRSMLADRPAAVHATWTKVA